MNVGDGPPVSLPLPDPSDLRLVSYMFVDWARNRRVLCQFAAFEVSRVVGRS